MKITYLGHSSLHIEIDDKSIIVDPFITGNPKAKHIEIAKLTADFILLTHAHEDHILDVETIADNTGATIIANHEIATHYGQKKHNVHGMNHGGSWNFNFGRISVVKAIHSSSFPDGTYGGNPVGFIITNNGKTIYISGDTALTMDMKLIPLFHKLDLAIFPIGGNYTMDVDQALIASDFVECDKVMGVHFDTFPMIEIDHQEANKKYSDKGKELILIKIGDCIEI